MYKCVSPELESIWFHVERKSFLILYRSSAEFEWVEDIGPPGKEDHLFIPHQLI